MATVKVSRIHRSNTVRNDQLFRPGVRMKLGGLEKDSLTDRRIPTTQETQVGL